MASIDAPQTLLTFAIPCYNSAGYMDACIQSIMDACAPATDYQIVIVDDGSQKDETPAKADEWAAKHPANITAVHQENGGHGAAVLAGLAAARGMYFKVVDSDDWVDRDAVQSLMACIREQLGAGELVDLYITDYVYEHTLDNTSLRVGYSSCLPCGRVFAWDEAKKFRPDQNLLMHALLYRTEVLRAEGVPLPRHTFYVDNIYAYVPLPRCRKLFYLPVDIYHYFIGREDQSVNEKVMVGRYEMQLRITRIMIEAYHLYEDVDSPRLRAYMLNYFVMMMVISTLFGHMSDDPASDAKVDELWAFLKGFDERMYKHARRSPLVIGVDLPGKVGRRMSLGLYHLAQKIFKFN